MSEARAFESQPHTRQKGLRAEEEASLWLERQGLEVVERNVVTHAGEIDIIAREGEVLCFVEVKARASDVYGPAIEAVDARKQRRLVRAASLYLALRNLDTACRFDVLGMDLEPEGWRFTLIRNAFEAA
jgi:putative endonuclease